MNKTKCFYVTNDGNYFECIGGKPVLPVPAEYVSYLWNMGRSKPFNMTIISDKSENIRLEVLERCKRNPNIRLEVLERCKRNPLEIGDSNIEDALKELTDWRLSLETR